MARLPDLTIEQKTLLHEKISLRRGDYLKGMSNDEIIAIGEVVMTDALRYKPRIEDVQTAPSSFEDNIFRLANMNISPITAFEIVGEAIVIARNFTKHPDAFRS